MGLMKGIVPMKSKEILKNRRSTDMFYIRGYYIGADHDMDRGVKYHLNISTKREPDLDENREFCMKIVGYEVRFIKVGCKNYTGYKEYRSMEELYDDWVKE